MTTTNPYISVPGEILLEEFLQPLGISQYRLAKAIGGVDFEIPLDMDYYYGIYTNKEFAD